MRALRKVEDFVWKLDNGGGEAESASEREVDKGLKLEHADRGGGARSSQRVSRGGGQNQRHDAV